MFSFLIAFLIWAVVHSLTASAVVKTWVREQVSLRAYEGFYRLVYNLLAVVTLLPALYFWLQLPDAAVWRVTGVGALLLNLLRLLGLVGAAVSLIQTDFLDFIGVRQMLDYFARAENGRAARNRLTSTLVTSGAYAWMRHPLYTFSMLILWANPNMSRNMLLLTIAFTLYFWIGSIYEERRLTAAFGEAYARYQQAVPRFVPRPW